MDPKPEAPNDTLAAHITESLRGASASERTQILTTLYQQYAGRFASDNNRIWMTATTMVPLSLGAFGVLASVPKPSLSQVIALPILGWLLMTIWLVIAENHRAFQDRSMAWMQAIERAWGITPDGTREKVGFLVRPGLIRRMRFALWWTVTAAAILAIFLWPGGLFIKPTG